MTLPDAFVYKRCSDPTQKEGDSMRRQTPAAKLCEEKGWKLNTSIELVDEGLSGFDGSNRETGRLGEFLRLVRAGDIPRGSVLICEDLDRLSRQEILIALRLFTDLLQLGICIYTTMDERLYTHEGLNRDPWVLHGILVSFTLAHLESKKKQERLNAWWEQARKRAGAGEIVTSRPPGWLTWDVKSSAWAIVPDRAEAVRRVFDLSIDGLGCAAIAKQLNREGRPTLAYGERWRSSSVRKVLLSRSVVGEWQPHRMDGKKRIPIGQAFPGYYPSLISEDRFALAQSALRQRRGKPGVRSDRVDNLFVALVRCGHDGSPMVFRRGTGRGGKGASLKADPGQRGKTGIGLSVPYDPLEWVLLRWLRELSPRDLSPAPARPEAETLRARIDAHRARLAELTAAMKNRDRPIQAVLDAAGELEEEIARWEEDLRQASDYSETAGARGLDEARTLIASLDGLQGEELKQARIRLRARIAGLVAGIVVWIKPRTKMDRTFDLALTLRSGAVRHVRFRSVGARLQQAWLAYDGTQGTDPLDAWHTVK